MVRVTDGPERCEHHAIDLRFRFLQQAVVRPSSDLAQCGALMHGDVFGLVAADLVLRFVFARMVSVALVNGVLFVNLDDPASHMASLGVPADMIARFECCCRHDVLLSKAATT